MCVFDCRKVFPTARDWVAVRVMLQPFCADYIVYCLVGMSQLIFIEWLVAEKLAGKPRYSSAYSNRSLSAR